MTAELIEERLRHLDVETPDAGRVSARVLGRLVKPRRRRAPRAAVASVAFMILVGLIAYFVPAADLAVAPVPVAGDVLNIAGLVGARDRITVVNAAASSSGYRVKLVAAYADSTRTVIIMGSDPVAPPNFSAVTLTDQFGRAYDLHGGMQDFQTGDAVFEFDALAWPDQLTGARITVHVAAVDVGEPPASRQVAGSWTLAATLGVDVARSLPLPSPADLGPAHFRFTSAAYTPATIEVVIEVAGVSSQDLDRMIPDGGKGFPALQVEVIDPNGQAMPAGGSSSGNLSTTEIHVLVYRTGGAGRYVLRVSLYGAGSFERVLTIP